MSDTPLRFVKLWDAKIEWQERDDGTILVWQKDPLPPYPDRLSERIEKYARETPDKTWMAERDDDGSWKRISFGEMRHKIRSIGQVLLDLGLGTDHPVVILSENSLAHALIALGAQYVGIPSAAIAPAYSLMSDSYEKLSSIRDQITPGAVFAHDINVFSDAINAVFSDIPRLGVTGENLHITWDALVGSPVTDAVDEANRATGPDTIAKFLFTSGTTGSPKAVIQTQRMMCANLEMVADCYAYLRDEPPVLLDWAPWNHVASGNKVFNMPIYFGGTFYIDRGRPTPQLIGETIRNLREISPNWYFNVPVGYEMLVEAMKSDPKLAGSFFKNLKLMMYAGAAMASHTWKDLEDLALDAVGERVFLSTGLGATETAPFGLFNTQPASSPGNIGVPSKGLVLKLVPNEGKLEARLKGPSVTPGYWRNPKLTAEAFDNEEFYCLGDALRFAVPGDPSKGFYFDGRVAENFKMATGTWVAVGALRAALTNALGGLARDVVIAGEGKDRLAALLIPFRPAIERLVDDAASLPDEALFAHPDVVSKVSELLAKYNKTAGGSSMRVPLAMFLGAALDLDKGEITDKGSVNQRAVLRNREDLVAQLYEGGPRVIRAA